MYKYCRKIRNFIFLTPLKGTVAFYFSAKNLFSFEELTFFFLFLQQSIRRLVRSSPKVGSVPLRVTEDSTVNTVNYGPAVRIASVVSFCTSFLPPFSVVPFQSDSRSLKYLLFVRFFCVYTFPCTVSFAYFLEDYLVCNSDSPTTL